jgi:hypothetical protein
MARRHGSGFIPFQCLRIQVVDGEEEKDRRKNRVYSSMRNKQAKPSSCRAGH